MRTRRKNACAPGGATAAPGVLVVLVGLLAVQTDGSAVTNGSTVCIDFHFMTCVPGVNHLGVATGRDAGGGCADESGACMAIGASSGRVTCATPGDSASAWTYEFYPGTKDCTVGIYGPPESSAGIGTQCTLLAQHQNVVAVVQCGKIPPANMDTTKGATQPPTTTVITTAAGSSNAAADILKAAEKTYADAGCIAEPAKDGCTAYQQDIDAAKKAVEDAASAVATTLAPASAILAAVLAAVLAF